MADQELKQVTIKMSDAELAELLSYFKDDYIQDGTDFRDAEDKIAASLVSTQNPGEYVFSYNELVAAEIDLILDNSPIAQAIKNNVEASPAADLDYLNIPAFLRRQEDPEPEVTPEPKPPVTDDPFDVDVSRFVRRQADSTPGILPAKAIKNNAEASLGDEELKQVTLNMSDKEIADLRIFLDIYEQKGNDFFDKFADKVASFEETQIPGEYILSYNENVGIDIRRGLTSSPIAAAIRANDVKIPAFLRLLTDPETEAKLGIVPVDSIDTDANKSFLNILTVKEFEEFEKLFPSKEGLSIKDNKIFAMQSGEEIEIANITNALNSNYIFTDIEHHEQYHEIISDLANIAKRSVGTEYTIDNTFEDFLEIKLEKDLRVITQAEFQEILNILPNYKGFRRENNEIYLEENGEKTLIATIEDPNAPNVSLVMEREFELSNQWVNFEHIVDEAVINLNLAPQAPAITPPAQAPMSPKPQVQPQAPQFNGKKIKHTFIETDIVDIFVKKINGIKDPKKAGTYGVDNKGSIKHITFTDNNGAVEKIGLISKNMKGSFSIEYSKDADNIFKKQLSEAEKDDKTAKKQTAANAEQKIRNAAMLQLSSQDIEIKGLDKETIKYLVGGAFSTLSTGDGTLHNKEDYRIKSKYIVKRTDKEEYVIHWQLNDKKVAKTHKFTDEETIAGIIKLQKDGTYDIKYSDNLVGITNAIHDAQAMAQAAGKLKHIANLPTHQSSQSSSSDVTPNEGEAMLGGTLLAIAGGAGYFAHKESQRQQKRQDMGLKTEDSLAFSVVKGVALAAATTGVAMLLDALAFKGAAGKFIQSKIGR